MKHTPLSALALLAFSVTSHAQSILPPWTYPLTLSTTPQQVLPADPSRRRVIFHNPSGTTSIAFCASAVTRGSVPYTCAVNGPGSITLVPYGSFTLDGGTDQGPPLSMSAAWIGVGSAAGAPGTIEEFE